MSAELADADAQVLLDAFGEWRLDERMVFLPVVGYRSARQISVRHCARWHRLLTQLRDAGLDARDWPQRPEGIAGAAESLWWRGLLAYRGEAALLRALEHRLERDETRSARRRRGRPPWTTRIFDDRYAEAVSRSGATTDSAVAAHFRTLGGDTGISPSQLARLRRRRTQGRMRE